MPLAYRSHSGDVEDGIATTTLTITKPAGLVTGDLMIAIVWAGYNGTTANITANTSGFTDTGITYTPANNGPECKIFRRVATASEAASYRFGIDNNATTSIEILAFSGANATQFDVAPVFNTALGTTNPHTAASATAVNGNTMLITSWAAQNYKSSGTYNTVWTPQAGMTKVADYQSAYIHSSSAYQLVSASGATGTRTASWTVSGGVHEFNYSAVTILVRPDITTTIVSATDSGAGTDTASVAATATQTDSGAGTDAVALQQAYAVTDSAVGTDSAAVTQLKPVADSGTGTDSIDVTVIEFKSVTDSAAGTDSIYVDIPVLKSVTDSATGTDTPAVQSVANPNDSAIGTDDVGLYRTTNLQDAAAAADTVAVQRQSSVADSATGTSSTAIARASTVDDTAVGTDSISILRRSAVTDSAIGTETFANGPLSFDSGVGSEEITVRVIPFTQVLPLKLGIIYDVVVVARVPQVSGPPQYIEVDPIEWKSLSYGNTLSDAQDMTVSCQLSSVTEPVLQRLRALSTLATEIWLYRNGKIVFAGPILGFQTSGEDLTVKAGGILTYLKLMVVTADLRFAQVDQNTIVKSMVDQWQALDYGNFGIDTSSITASGQKRDVVYERDELHNIGQRVADLGKLAGGFDAEVDPASRKLQLWSPGKGVDRSVGEDAIVIDARNITSGDILCSVAIGDLASEAYVTGTSSGTDATLYAMVSNTELRAHYGRSAVTSSYSDVTAQTTLASYAQGLLDARSDALLVPGPKVRVTPDADLTDYSVGDTIAYELSSNLGISGAFRIRKQTITASPNGQESVDLEFV